MILFGKQTLYSCQPDIELIIFFSISSTVCLYITLLFTVTLNNFIKMNRPNFQMIEDSPEKNYMRYVSLYRLDDLVNHE